jgi:signal peptidase I
MTGWVLAILGGAVVVGGAVVRGAVRARRRFVEVTITGTSMAPTFTGGERVLVERARVGRLRRGDIVVVRCTPPGVAGPVQGRPGRYHLWLIKRVAAVAGDPVPADVAAAAGRPAGSRIPDGRFVVLGDNADGSLDSRTCGLFDTDCLLGIMRGHRP